MKRAIDGNSTNKYATTLLELYSVLEALTRKNLIFCPIGSQHEEIGVSEKKQSAEEFFQRFANSELKAPDEIKNLQLDLFYDAYTNHQPGVELPYTDVFTIGAHWGHYTIRVVSKLSDRLLSEIKTKKEHIAKLLTESRSSGIAKGDFKEQLFVELSAEQQAVEEAIYIIKNSTDEYLKAIKILSPIFNRIQTSFQSQDFVEKFSEYQYGFLMSIYLFHVPYIWISSNLFAKRVISGRIFSPSDSQDTENTASYLPYVNYFVTDRALCTLIKELELDKHYNTRVYSMGDLESLIVELRSLDKEL